MAGSKVLLIWQEEQKTGIEDASAVPSSSRQAGCIAPVLFSGDKKWYPAKIVMVSDDMEALEEKERQVAKELEKEKAELPAKRKRNVKRSSSSATETQIAAALGSKRPVPPEVAPAKAASLKANRERKQANRQAQLTHDSSVLERVLSKEPPCKRNLGFDSGEDDTSLQPQGVLDQVGKGSKDDHDESCSDDENDGTLEKATDESCSCKASCFLSKYNTPVIISFLKDLLLHLDVVKTDSVQQPMFLEILPGREGEKMVPLTDGMTTMISRTVKTQLKADFRNKPTALAKETLFVLFGKEVFQTLSITGRGTKEGTYGIEDHVLQAVVSFVNRHVDKKMSKAQLIALINKRASDWRKPSTPTNFKVKPKKSLQTKKRASKVKATSPWKSKPVDEDSSEEESGAGTAVDQGVAPKEPSERQAVPPSMAPAYQPQSVPPSMAPAHQPQAVPPSMAPAHQPQAAPAPRALSPLPEVQHQRLLTPQKGAAPVYPGFSYGHMPWQPQEQYQQYGGPGPSSGYGWHYPGGPWGPPPPNGTTTGSQWNAWEYGGHQNSA